VFPCFNEKEVIHVNFHFCVSCVLYTFKLFWILFLEWSCNFIRGVSFINLFFHLQLRNSFIKHSFNHTSPRNEVDKMMVFSRWNTTGCKCAGVDYLVFVCMSITCLLQEFLRTFLICSINMYATYLLQEAFLHPMYMSFFSNTNPK